MSPPRPAAVAGRFYPDDPDRLRAAVDAYVDAGRPAAGTACPKAIIAPHAGYPYSGPVAGSAYAALGAGRRPRVDRVLLLGPAHAWPLPGLAVPSAAAFLTPLGPVPIDAAAVARLRRFAFVHVADDAHAREHSLEVQLPFLQCVLPDPFAIVPVAVGRATAAQVDAVLEELWGGDETLIVVSSDLSHYHDYATARRLDRATSAAIEAMDPEGIGELGACGRVPLQGLLRVGARHGLLATMVDLRSSGDTAGSRSQVVGYGAYVLC